MTDIKGSDTRLVDGGIVREGRTFGCHCDLNPDEKPDGCVIDNDDHWSCIYAVFKSGRKRQSRWTCEFWY
jgi:hypothetical protein